MQARIHHVNVPAHDVRLVARFYSEVIGLTEVEMPVKEGLATPEQQQIAWFDPGNRLTGLHVVLPQVRLREAIQHVPQSDHARPRRLHGGRH